MISGTTSCFPNVPQGLQQINMYGGVAEDVVVSSDTDTNTNSLLYSLSVLKEKVHQVQSLVTIFISPHKTQPAESTAIATASLSTLIQEIIVTASSMMFTCQQMSLPTTSGNNELFDWYGDHNYNTNCNNTISNNINEMERTELRRRGESSEGISRMSNDIIELDAADILAKYTHYCQVCGKGFKRDANLRMHMRAHGDEYKSSSALSNPMKKNKLQPRKYYSCPQEGCRWNRKHHKFQPLKSMICVKNHYKRSHCPKMYVCKRCNRKHFSVLSDLRTHEKHCGLIKWQCSCGTTFSRKDKLMGHVALFAGHMPAINSSTKIGKVEQFATQMRPD